MSQFTLLDLDSAPKASQPLLQQSQKAFGSIPNLHAVMAHSPQVLDAYQQLHQLFVQCSLSDEEKTVVWQTINLQNQCHYCVPAHTAIAKMMKISDKLIDALRHNKAMPTIKLQVLHDTTVLLLKNHGQLSESEQQKFYDAGFNQAQLLEVVLGISQKTLSNYVNHLAKTPLDDAFKPYA
ncbi:carboxymuconolactone decarboxylase family protein [Arsukibacterium sp.]|uniref:carboxymuconolactone decarboxylase family protein n=1 Tax=Arsukibacterium sp. TaxID=1977258 RepID=UPI00356492F6